MKISIITVVYNNKSHIINAINSVLEQDYYDIEYIVIDGGSNDGTQDIILNNSYRITKWISEQDKGIYYAMNKGLSMATGEVIGILNSDDVYSNKCVISDVMNYFNNDNNLQAVYGDLVYIDTETKNKLRYWRSNKFVRKKFLWGWMPPHPAFFVKKDILNKYGSFDISLKSAADYELMLRLLYKYEIKTTYLPKILIFMTAGGVSNRSLKNRILANIEDRKAWKLNDIKPYFLLYI